MYKGGSYGILKYIRDAIETKGCDKQFCQLLSSSDLSTYVIK